MFDGLRDIDFCLAYVTIVFSLERVNVVFIIVILVIAARWIDAHTFRVEGQSQIGGKLIAEFKVINFFFFLEVLEEPVGALAELNMAFDSSSQTMAKEAQIDETWAHCHLLRAKRIPVLLRIQLLRLVYQRCPLDIVLLMIDFRRLVIIHNLLFRG